MLNDILRGRYKIIKHLGGGGFGQTYLAEDIDLPKHPICVVKQLKPSSKEPNVLAISKRLFDQEAEALYSLGSHDRIPRLLAHFQEGKEFYLVQEFADGNDLSQEIGKGIRLPEVLAIPLLTEILEILVFIHDRGVVHRDIKPANLIRRKSDRKIVLIDFGAVKEIGSLAVDPQGNTNLTIAIGSPGYMPIEQINGKPRFSSDIYALGMMLIQAITGAEPRRFDEHPETAELIWRDRLPPDSYSPKFLDILEKMVRYDFRQRYQSAKEVLAALSLLPESGLIDSQAGADGLNASNTNLQDLTIVNANSQTNDLLPTKISIPKNNFGKIAIASIIVLGIIGVGTIIKFLATPSKNQASNNSSQLVSQPAVVKSSTSPIETATPSITPLPNREVLDLIKTATNLRLNYNKPEEALKIINKAIDLDVERRHPGAFREKGLILQKMDKDELALKAFEEGIKTSANPGIYKTHIEALLIKNPKLKKIYEKDLQEIEKAKEAQVKK